MAERKAERRGGGISRRRLAQVLAVFAVFNLGLAALLLAQSYPPEPGNVDTPVPDFLAFWAAARLAVEGTAWLAYDVMAHKAAEQAAMGVAFDSFLVWYYPPLFQLLLMPLALLPLAPAMAVWLIGGAAFFLYVCHRILPDRLALLGALAAAPTLLNLVNGQTGFLIAGLAGLALLDQQQRPVAAGTALGLLAIKPHPAFALPLAMLAGGRWRVLGVALGVLLLLTTLSAVVLGGETWQAFRDNMGLAAGAISDTERRWDLHPTLYALLRLGGLTPGPALAIHTIPAAAVLWLTFRAWRSPPVSPDIRAALVCYATAFAMPRLLHYDLHILTIGVLFQLRHALAAGTFRGEAALIGAALLALEVSVFSPPLLMPLAAPALFLGCLAGHARGVLPGQPRSAVPSGGRSWVDRG